jgi:hypothetical protein
VSDDVDVYSAAEYQLVRHFKAEGGVVILRDTVAIQAETGKKGGHVAVTGTYLKQKRLLDG